MAHDDQFTATGPSFTGAGFPRAGFSTKSTDTVHGVNVVGTSCGVYGESLGPGQESDRQPEVDRTGVFGDGDRYGVHGIGRTFAGVLGFVRRPENSGGVFGIALRGAPGVVGQSRIDFLPDLPQGDFTLHGGEGTGVLGESGHGTGVSGESGSGIGVSGSSNSSYGGLFSSGGGAQVRLDPSEVISSPATVGRPGDLLAVKRGSLASLWFCILAEAGDRPAVWGKVHLGQASIPNPTLEQGAQGQDVKNAQGLLLAHGNSPGPVDGIFGPQTLAATRAFQQAAAIVVDGQIGPQTWGALLNHF
ncbi:peptidoglycan-binding domain-containing protein [Streptomyces capoamus]|uniref:peptidoglycan-binding domain-containing protein n=1 Tax=Streptomyces capoamus TaxID=68183 RepID=UPI003C2C385C